MRHHHFGHHSRYHVLGVSVTVILTLFYVQSGVTQVSLGGVDIPYTQNFNSLASGGGTGSNMPAHWVFLETGAGSNGTYSVNDGGLPTENTYSYGTGSATERALGQINTATFSTKAGASFINNTGVTITSLLIQYFGEQWRLGAVGRTDRIDFQYSTNATAIDNGTWTDFDGLDFTAPIQAGSVGALDGNAAANRRLLAKTITGLSIANGATIWIRWNSWEATSDDDGLAIDDFALTANPSLHYTVSNNGVTLSITDTGGNGEGLYVTQQGTSIRFYAPGRTYSLNAGATTALPIDVTIAGLSFIVINAGSGNDTIHVGAFTTNLPGFTINGGINNDVVNMNGDINFISGAAFNADLQNDDASPGVDKFNVAANANIVCAGTGISTIKVSSNIVLNSLSSVATANGNLTIEANQQFTPTTGDFDGIEIMADALLQVTGSGVMSVKGRGGNTGSINYGVFVHDGGEILGGTSGTLTVEGIGGPCSGSSNAGIAITQSTSRISSAGGNVVITGTGGGVGSSSGSPGILMNSGGVFSAGGNGTVTVTGTGAAMPGTNFGISIANDATITSNNGNVLVTGFGGGSTGSNNYGVYLWSGGIITAGGTGTVTVNGTGGNSTGNANDGVSLYLSDAMITSSGGDVMVTGQGGGAMNSGSGVGVHLTTDVSITAGGLGDVTVTGTGAAINGINNFGIFLQESTSTITSNGGNVTLVGQGGGSGSSSGNYGIVVFQSTVSAGGSGLVSLTGTGGTSSGANNVGIRVSEVNGKVTSGGGNITLTGIEGSGPDGFGISVYSSGTVTTNPNGGTITMIGNSMNIAGTISTVGTNNVSFRPYTAGVDVFLGPVTNIIGGPLHLSDAELDFVSALTILIGNTTTGDITVSSPITRSALTNINLLSNDNVTLNGGNINTNGGNISLDPGGSPDAVRPLQTGNDATCGTLTLIGSLSINIDGTVADVSYSQVQVVGAVMLTNASLACSGTHVPQPGNVFTIVVNDGADAVSGTFSGLPQGGTIVNFMGSGLPATISYTGGTGNDIVITVGAPDYIITNASGILSLVDFSGNGETLSISQNGTNIRFDVLTRTYSLNGGAVTNFPVDIAIAGLTSITADAAIGADVINVAGFTTALPSLTLNGGTGDETINFNGDINFVSNASLNVDLQNDDPSPGIDQIVFASGAVLALTGTGSATLKVSRNITMATASGITTVNGALSVEANQQVTPTAGSFQGINMAGNSLLQATGIGVVTVKGKGGDTSGSQRGIESSNGDIIGGTSGTMIIEGIGGASVTSGSHDGIRLFSGGAISSAGAHITITGTAGGTGSTTSNIGVNVSTSGSIAAAGTGNVTITANGGIATGVNQFGFAMGTGSSVTSNSGNIIINGYGGDNSLANSAHGVSISGGTITSGGAGTVFLHGEGGAAGTSSDGVNMINSPSKITSNGGTVTVTGLGGGSGASASCSGVAVLTGAQISAGNAGTVVVQGTGGMGTGASNYGVEVTGSGALITSSGGAVQVTGNGGVLGTATGNNHGVIVDNSGKIKSGGNGNTTVTGSGGGTNTTISNYGVILNNSGEISASGTGLVIVNGTGGFGSGNFNSGVFLTNNGLITSSGGDVTVSGTGGGAGGSGGNCTGVHLNAGKISATGGGDVYVTGYGSSATGTFNYGVLMETSGLITSAGGPILVTGHHGGGAQSYGINIIDNAEVNTVASGGSIHLVANSMHLNGRLITDPAYFVWLSPITNGMDINLGTAGDINAGPLQLSDTELDSVSTGYLLIGSTIAGDITTTADITRTSSTNMSLQSTDDVLIDVGLINTGGGDLSIIPGESPDAMYPLKAGSDMVCNTFYPIGNIEINITGLVADADYTQFNITGAVNLEDASLILSGSHVPQPGQTFIIINNDGADAIENTFVGLAEGASITSFLGGPYPATISYVGGTGNDVVITVSSPDYVLTTTGNQIVFTDIAGNGETITMNQSGLNNVEFVVAGRNYSLNGGAVTPLPVVADLQAMNMVTINSGVGHDEIIVNAFTASMCHLTLNGGVGNDVVTMNGDMVFAANANLNIDLQNDDPSPGEDRIQLSANVNLPLLALGIATLKCSRNINLNAGSSLTTVNGNLTLEANQQATPTTGTFYGVFLADNSLVEVTGAGTLDVKGKGGTTSNAQIGVYVYNSAILRGGPTGDHFVNGTGGATTSNDNRGIQVQLNAVITTNGGNLFLTAQGGGTGASAHNHGMHVVQGGIITAGGMGNVTINTFGGLPTGIRNHGIHVYGAGSIITSNGGNVHVYGQSGGTGISSYNHGVFVEDLATITAGGLGTVTIEGVGGNPSGERNDGVICFRDGATITSGGGDVHVTGQGGGSGTSQLNYGVFLDFGGNITAGGMGDLYINGTGGATTGVRNAGVFVYLENSYINTSGGDAYITGQGGGAGGSNENFGVYVLNGAMVSAGGAGNVFINGTGGNTTGTRNDGVLVEGDTAIITSSDGNVEVIGLGAGNGVAFRNYGVFANNSGVITAGGTGNVHVVGTGAPAAEGVRNYGVVIANPGSMITGSGAITVTGQGGGSGVNSNNNFGTYLTAGSIIAQGNGTIDIDGTGGNAQGPYNFGVYTTGSASMIATSNGDINIIGHGAGTGALATNSIGVRFDGHVSAGGIGNVNVEGYGGLSNGNNNWGLALEGTEGDITTFGGNINAFGQGGGSGNANTQIGVYLGGGAQIIAGNEGTTTIEGIGGNPVGGSNYGVYLQTAGTIISSSGGDVSVTGQGGGNGGAGFSNYGIDVATGANISAGGDGNVTLDGTGGVSSVGSNFGVIVSGAGASITSTDGDIHIAAQGGGTGTGITNIGFYLLTQGMVAAGGTGNILIEATGGNTMGDFNYGAMFWQVGTSVTTTDGNIEIIGMSNSSNNAGLGLGVNVFDAVVSAGGSGDVTIHGEGATSVGVSNHGVNINGMNGEVSTEGGDIFITGVPGGGVNQFGIRHTGGAQIHTVTGGGNIKLLSNTMTINADIETLPADTIFMSALTTDTSIVLGAVGDLPQGPLMLSDMELDSVTTGTLIIGRNTTGTITLIDTISRMTITNVNLVSDDDVIFDGGMLSANGGNVLLDPGPSPAAVLPTQYGHDVSCGVLSFGSDLLVNINGPIADTLHDQLNVIGEIDLSGVDLIFSGSYSPVFADTFLIIHNDNADAITGTFTGLPEGGTITNFLGTMLSATITYVGGDGNDVVISMIAPHYLITDAGGHLVITDLAGNGETLTVSEMAGNMRFNVAGRNYSYNYNSITNLPLDVSLAGIDSITINTQGGNDNITINTFIQQLPGLNINGGAGNENISFAGDITFLVDADLRADLQDDDPVPGTDQINLTTNTNLILSGQGEALMKVSRNITLNTGASLETVHGDIRMEANKQIVPTAENFSGISVLNATIEITGDGQVNLNGQAGATTGSNHGIRIESGGDVIAGTSGQMVLEGTGGNSNVGNAHGININGAGSTISSNGADVMVTGYGGGSASGDINSGVDVNMSGLISAGGNGVVIVNGTGGNSAGSNNNGVRVISGGMITSTANNVTVTGLGNGSSAANISTGVSLLLGGIISAGGMGIVTVNGTGGVGTGNSNHGILVNGAGSAIQSADGDVFVTGFGGGTGTSAINNGVSIAGSGKIAPGGTGNLVVEGTGGLVDGSTNYGVSITQTGSLISSNSGNVSVTGHGGGTNASGFNYGVAVQVGTISAGGQGQVQVEGYGGASNGTANHGIFIRNPLSLITSSGGHVDVAGYGMGTGQACLGVVLENEGVISAGGLGNVDVTGASSPTGSHLNRGIYISGLNTKITSSGGDVTVVGQGGGIGTAGSSNGLLLVSQGMVTAGGSGNVSVTGTGGGGTGSNNAGIALQNANTMITSSGGNVIVQGQGGGVSTSSSNYGIEMLTGSMITAGGTGNVEVTGNGNATSGSSNHGIFLNGTNTRITSAGGDVSATGTGGGSGASGSNYGVYLLNASKILADGSGNVTINGQGGFGSSSGNTGVFLTGSGSQITSTNGDVDVSGIGGGSMAATMNIGVLVDANTSIGADGAGHTNVTGQGGTTTGSSNYGVAVINTNATITSAQGDINITGQGGGSGTSGFNFGVIVSAQGIVNANESGNIFIAGSGGPSTGGSNMGIALSGNGNAVHSELGNIFMAGEEGGGPTGIGFSTAAGSIVSSDAGSIKVSANSMDMSGSIQASSLDTTQLFPYDASVRIELMNGLFVLGGPLRLNDAQLDLISTGVLTIGHPVADTILVAIPVTRSNPTDVCLITAGDVIFNPGTINTNGGNLLLDPGPTPMAVKPVTSGLDITMDTVSFGSDLAIVINGSQADVQYYQLHVNGVVNLTGVDLVLSGSYTPLETDTFVIVKNDGTDMIISTFNGLLEGDTIIDVLDDTLDAIITYAGGDGNDVVIRMIQPCQSPSDIVISTTADTACAGTMITLELESGNLGGATEWHWYRNGCGSISEGTGTSIVVTPTDTTTYYVRGEGGCVINDECVSKTIVIHPFPDATIYQEFPDSCYYIDRLFRPESPEIPGATYAWNFGPTAVPTSAIGYGPHIVYYTVPGVKNVELVIHPNADGAQCADSSTVTFTIYNCPGQIVGDVKSDLGNPIASVNVRLFSDADTNGIADNSTALRSVFTTSLGVYAMASLTPGHYVLVQTQPAGWLSLDDLDSSDDGDVVTNVDSLDNIIPVTIVPREEDEDNKFVERPAPGTITGVVFQDFDLDQFPDAGEGLNGITVELFKDANTNGVADTIVPFVTAVSAGNGNYSFPNIPVGHYVLVEIQDPGFTSIKDFDASNDSDVVPNTNMTNDTLPVTITNGETDAHNYFIDAPGCGSVVTNTLDDGPGSFRQALACVGVGDTIHFHPTLAGMTIEITSDPLMLTTDVVIESMLSPQVILSSQIEGMFHIEQNTAVELRGVTVISGLSQGNTGAAFENHGMLTLHNTTIVRNPLFVSGEYLIRNHPGAELTFSGECFIEND
jgi:hypothetical protein